MTRTDALSGAGADRADGPLPRRPAARRRKPGFTLTAGAAILAFWIACALLGRHIAPYDPYAEDFLAMLAPPDAAHWFGTDQLGRDVLSRVLAGSRDILLTAPLAALLGVGLGTGVGLALGYLGGWLDAVASRLLDAVMALPFVVMVTMVLVAVGPSAPTVVLVIAIAYAPLVARTVRVAVREQRGLDYVAAARLGGENAFGIMFLEILPNVRETVAVELVTRLGYAFFAVATLSFLGLGIQPPSADWGLAIAEGYGFLTGGKWWVVVFNAAAIVSLVVATNLVAQGLGLLEDWRPPPSSWRSSPIPSSFSPRPSRSPIPRAP